MANQRVELRPRFGGINGGNGIGIGGVAGEPVNRFRRHSDKRALLQFFGAGGDACVSCGVCGHR